MYEEGFPKEATQRFKRQVFFRWQKAHAILSIRTLCMLKKEHREVWSVKGVARTSHHKKRASDIRPPDGPGAFLMRKSDNTSVSESEGIMKVLRLLAPSISALFGLYCVMWGLLASSSSTSLRLGGAFLGVLFLLLAFVYVRVLLPREEKELSGS